MESLLIVCSEGRYVFHPQLIPSLLDMFHPQYYFSLLCGGLITHHLSALLVRLHRCPFRSETSRCAYRLLIITVITVKGGIVTSAKEQSLRFRRRTSVCLLAS